MCIAMCNSVIYGLDPADPVHVHIVVLYQLYQVNAMLRNHAHYGHSKMNL